MIKSRSHDRNIYNQRLGYLSGFRLLKDYRPDSPKVKMKLKKAPNLTTTLPKLNSFLLKALIKEINLFTPIIDQGSLRSCTAFSTVWISGYLQKNVFGSYTFPSSFIYKDIRNLL